MTGPGPGPRTAPLTYEQEWYAANTRRSTRVPRNVRLSYRILGPLDPELFEEAVRLFVARHDALRMLPVPAPGAATAQQVLAVDPADRPVLHRSVTASSADQFSYYAAAVLSRDVITPLTGDQRPFTLRLLRHDAGHHAFLATFGNLFFDGRAHDLFTREVWQDYAALRDTGEPAVPSAPSFAEAARRQREGYGPRHLERARASWHRRLEFAARHRWRELDGVRRTADGSVGARLPAATVAALREHCRATRCTVMHWLVGSFVRALAREAGQPRLSLWTSVDSRRPAERDVAGMFAGPAPLAIADPAAALPEVVAEVGHAMVDALRHQQFTAGELAGLLDSPPGAEAGGAPLARDVYVNLRSFPGDHRPVRADGELRITADAYPLRRITFQDSSALHLRCDEYRDTVLLDLLFDGRRVGEPLARTIVDRVVADAAAVHRTTSASRKALP